MENSIGTLSEKSIHSIIKNLLEPTGQYQEVKVGKYIADIKINNEIIEIQTAQFKKLVDKLNYYISEGYNITIVYPLIENKYINWVDHLTCEIIERRKSSYRGAVIDVLKELYWIIDILDNELVKIVIMCLSAEEYKYLDGYGQNRKKHSTKIDKVPTSIINKIEIKSVSDLKILVPNTLGKEFDSKEFIRESKSNRKWAASGVKMLREYNIIKVVRKEGNKFIYSRNF